MQHHSAAAPVFGAAIAKQEVSKRDVSRAFAIGGITTSIAITITG
jgi:hypothetical protein